MASIGRRTIDRLHGTLYLAPGSEYVILVSFGSSGGSDEQWRIFLDIGVSAKLPIQDIRLNVASEAFVILPTGSASDWRITKSCRGEMSGPHYSTNGPRPGFVGKGTGIERLAGLDLRLTLKRR